MDDSSQVRAIKQNRNKLAELIQGDLISIANDLNAQRLLPDVTHGNIVSNPPSFQSANDLIQRGIAQVKIDPAKYEVFRGVLEKHFDPEVLRKLLPKLDGESVLYCMVCS